MNSAIKFERNQYATDIMYAAQTDKGFDRANARDIAAYHGMELREVLRDIKDERDAMKGNGQ